LTKKDFDKAIEQFEKAIKQNPNISKLRNDLGVALLEKGKLAKSKCEEKTKLKQECEDEKEPYLLSIAKANEEFAKAIELENTSLEANFNQALCIQELNLPNQAKEAWQNYLNLDSTSKWADEARKNLETIETQKPISKNKEEILRDFLAAKDANDDEKAWQVLSRNREMITGKLIPQQLTFLFVDSKVIGDEANAKTALDALVYVGKLEEQKSGDLFWNKVAEFYSTNRNYSDLLKAQRLVFESYELTTGNEYNEALIKFRTAQSTFLKNQNILESKLCDYWIGTLLYRLHQINKSTIIYEEMAQFCNDNKFKWLASQAYTKLSINAGIGLLGKYSKALEYDEKALEFAEETDDLYGLQKIPSQIAYEYKQVGRYSLSLKYCQKSLKISALPEASRRESYRTYYFVSLTLYKMKLYETSILYQKEALNISNELNDKTFIHNANLSLGMINLSKERHVEAEAFLQSSLQNANSFPDEEEKVKAVSYSLFELGNLKRQMEQFEDAKNHYREAINFYDKSEYKLNRYESHKGLLQCLLKTTNYSEIEKEFSTLFEIFRKDRTEIIEAQNREAFFDNEQTVYDLAIDYENSKGNYEKSFNFSEESRSRVLLDLLKSGGTASNNEIEVKLNSSLNEPLEISEIRAQMPDSVQIVEYAVLADRIVIWLVTKDDFMVFSKPISTNELQSTVDLYLKTVSQNISEVDEENRLAKEIHKILIDPIKEKLDPNKKLCIIPDKDLFRVPFASLISPETGRYFITEQSFFISPSANVFLLSSKKAREFEATSSESLLSIGNPLFDTEQFPDLPNLPSAEDEVKSIGGNYKSKISLVGSHATKKEFLRNMQNANVIHIAGHYVVDDGLPLLSGLVLATEDNKANKQTSILTNFEIVNERFPNTKLLVLSACQTGIEKYLKGEGMIGASRTFLATGIPVIVGSQWKVDSEASSEIMKRLHFYRKNKQLSTIEALRQTQLDILNSDNDKFKQPYYWASFTVIGGYSEF
jgi:CHAT domain-containing protein/TolA-binding protein